MVKESIDRVREFLRGLGIDPPSADRTAIKMKQLLQRGRPDEKTFGARVARIKAVQKEWPAGYKCMLRDTPVTVCFISVQRPFVIRIWVREEGGAPRSVSLTSVSHIGPS